MKTIKEYMTATKETTLTVAKSKHTKEFAICSKEVIISALKSDGVKAVVGGAIAGALIGSMIPFVGIGIAAAAGAIIGGYKWFTK